MADDPTPSTDGATGGEDSGWTPPATQDDLNRIIKERVDRERAKYADYNDLKSKASKFDELTEAQKSEVQRATERAEALERELNTIRTTQQIATWKSQVAEATGVPADVLAGSTLEEIQAFGEKLKPLIAGAARDRAIIPNPGGVPESLASSDARQTVRELFGNH
jgi:hypothetical protein